MTQSVYFELPSLCILGNSAGCVSDISMYSHQLSEDFSFPIVYFTCSLVDKLSRILVFVLLEFSAIA